MIVKQALKKDLEGGANPVEGRERYSIDLHARFVSWKQQTGQTVAQIARKLRRPQASISDYLDCEYSGNIPALEKDIAALFQREIHAFFNPGPVRFCQTAASKLVWECLQFAHEEREMGLAVGPSGSGKTETAKAYRDTYPEETILVTANIVTRRPGSILTLIARRGGQSLHGGTISNLLERTSEKLQRSGSLVVIDDAHFLSWEAFEMVRNIHDMANVGIVFLGQEKLYDQMKGATNRAYLYDQIYSRVGIKRDRLPIERKDVKLIGESIFPGLEKPCVDFLFRKAQGKGRLRAVTKILKLAVKRHQEFGDPIDIDLLTKASRFLMI